MTDSSVVRINPSAFIKKNYLIISFILLIAIVFLGIYVRTSNISNLKDITTGNYTLGPDLDPFLYLRQAHEILSGTLTNPDMMVAAPLGDEPYAYRSLMPWAIIAVYKVLNIFSSTSLEYAAILTPVILTFFAIIFFFLFVRKSFSYILKKEYSYLGALIATALYSVTPQMLHRTTAGIPEIESLGMPFFWLALYFFFIAWESKDIKKYVSFAIISGISTGLMIWSWGGFRYIFMAIFATTFFVFFFQKLEKKNILVYSIWLIISAIFSIVKINSLTSTFTSVSDFLPATIVLVIILIDSINYEGYIKSKFKFTQNWPKQVLSIVISIVILLILSLALFGSSFVIDKTTDVLSRFSDPFGHARIGNTVAENKAPYFTEIAQSFSVTFFKLNISLFWLFFFGSIALFYFATKHFDYKNKIILNASFLVFLFGFIFSRISSTSILNGENFISKLLYFGSLLILVISLFYVYNRERNNLSETFHKIDFSYIFILFLALFSIISMRGAIRLIFIISPILIIVSAFLVVKAFEEASNKRKEESYSYYIILAVILLLLSLIILKGFAQASYNETKYTIPGYYEQQWQSAMSWVRDNTSQDAIFVHWWDYGYWIQTIGQRATVTDGAHLVTFWDHTTARYLMTAESEKTAFQLAKAHNVSYVLFDSTDIGKYGAYASIGSDKSGKDRLAYIPSFSLDDKQTQESKNRTTYIYTGGYVLDQDIILNNTLYPQGKAGIIGFAVSLSETRIESINAILYYNGKQTAYPINYIYISGNKIKLTDSGLDAVLYIVPSVSSSKINPIGGALFISEKVSNGEFGRAYLLGETNMTLAHKEDSPIITQVKGSYNLTSDFILVNGQIFGPIKIFKVPDLSNIAYHPEYTEKISIGENDFAKLDYLGK